MTVTLYVVGGLVALLVLWGWVSQVQLDRARLRLQQQGLYPESGQETDEDVERLLSMGRKIDAIKVYRAVHKVGLKEAKEAVEALAARLDRSRPSS